MTNEDLQREIKTGITVVKFGKDSCPPCRMLKPMLKRLAQDRRGAFYFYDIDLNQYPEYGKIYNIRSIPRTLIFNNGQLIEDITGANYQQIVSTIDNIT